MSSLRNNLALLNMANNSFFKKVLNYLGEINKGRQSQLIESGWIKQEEEKKINTILLNLDLIQKVNGRLVPTRKGLNILLYYKMGKITQEYDEDVLQLLLQTE